MGWTRAYARRALSALALPTPTRDRVLHVYTQTRGAIPDWRTQCLCHRVAAYVWRAAHENACTRIVVHRDAVHRHEFDTVDLLRRDIVPRLGYFPHPLRLRGRTPALLATRGHQALGNTLDERAPVFVNVPAAVSGNPGSQETPSHGV